MKHKFSKILALVLALCMAAAMLPLASFAAETDGTTTDAESTTPDAGSTEGETPDDGKYEIWLGVESVIKDEESGEEETVVNKVQVTKDNASDVLSDADAAAEKPASVAFDPETKTLTLTNAKLSALFDETVGGSTYGCALVIGEAVTLKLVGANEIEASGAANTIALMNTAAVELAGEGSLKINAKAETGYGYGIYSTANVTVSDCSVNATGSQNAMSIANSEALLTVKSGTLSLTSTNNAALMLTYAGTKKQVQIDGGTVILSGKTYGAANSSAVKFAINGGIVTAAGSQAFSGSTAPDLSGYKTASVTAGSSQILAEEVDMTTVTDWHSNKYVYISEGEQDDSDIGESAVTVEGGVATIAPIDKNTIVDAVSSGASALTIKLSELKEEVFSAVLHIETLEVIVAAAEAAKNTDVSVVIELTAGTVELDIGAMNAIIKQAGNTRTIQIFFNEAVELTPEQSAAIGELKDARAEFEVYIMANETEISDLESGTITISVPCTIKANEVASGFYIVSLAEDGTTETMKSSWDGKMHSFEVGELSAFALGYDGEKALVYRNCTKDKDCPMSPFNDARIWQWYHDGIHFCLDNGIMQGYANGLFGTTDPVTRGQLVTMLWRMEGCPETTYPIYFEDVSKTDYYYDAIRWAMSEEIIQGYNNKSFAPKDDITREQLVVIMWRYAKYKGIGVDGGKTDLSTYEDINKVSDWAVSAMQWGVGTGLIQGVESGKEVLLQPKESATRAQIATILTRYCEGTIPALAVPVTPPAEEEAE